MATPIKTAVLFYGEIRGCVDHWKNLHKKIVIPNNADVFIHGYYYPLTYLDDLSGEEKVVLLNFQRNKGIHKLPPWELFDIFSPKAVCFEKPKSHSDDYLKNNKNFFYESILPDSVENRKVSYDMCMSQAHTRKKVIDLKIQYEKENRIEYDNVILTRLDFNAQDTIYIDNKLDALYAGKYSPTFIKDHMIWGPSKNIDVICSFYEKAPGLFWNDCPNKHPILQYEYYLYLHIRQQGLEVKEHIYPPHWTNMCVVRFDKDWLNPTESCNIKLV